MVALIISHQSVRISTSIFLFSLPSLTFVSHLLEDYKPEEGDCLIFDVVELLWAKEWAKKYKKNKVHLWRELCHF